MGSYPVSTLLDAPHFAYPLLSPPSGLPVIPALIFHAPLTSDLILLKGVGVATFTRGSVGNVLDHEQVMKELIIDAPRFTGARTDGTLSYPDDGVNPIPDVNLDGILIEGQVTNIQDYTTFEVDTSGNGLSDGWGSIPTGFTCTRSNIDLPDELVGSGIYSQSFENDGTTANAYQINNVIDVVDNQDYTISGWIKFDLSSSIDPTFPLITCGGANLYLSLYYDDVGDGSLVQDWTHFEISKTAVGTGTVGFFRLVRATSTDHNFDNVSFAGIQVEPLEFKSSYIKTNLSTETRAGDLLTYPTASNIDANQGSMIIEFMPYGGEGALFGAGSDGINYTWLNYSSTDVTFLKMIAGSVYAVDVTTTITMNEKHRVGIRWDAVTGMAIWLDGVKGEDIANFAPLALGSEMIVGNRIAEDYPAFADIRDVQIANYAISDVDMATLTTVPAYVYDNRKVVTNNGIGVTV